MGRAESAPSWAYQCPLRGVSSHALSVGIADGHAETAIMKIIRMIIGVLGIGLLPYLLPAQDSIVQIVADAQGLQPVSPDQLPRYGTFWLVMPGGPNACSWAPLPTPPVNAVPVYQVADGQFIVDGTIGEIVSSEQLLDAQSNAIVSLIYQIQGTQMTSMTMAAAMDSPPSPDGSSGGSGGGSNGFDAGFNFIINTNLLWLQTTNVSNGTAYANLFNATNYVYAIWSTPDLTIPFSLWSVETEVFPTNSTTNVLPFTVLTLDRPDLFLRAQDWTGVYANGLPCWWTWYYFHSLNYSVTDEDSSGRTLGYDYSNHIDPNAIVFTIEVTNAYVNTATPNLPLNIASGVPGYAAVLVNDTNHADAAWQPYNGSNVLATLGVDGGYNVSVGLRGFPSNATQTWQTVALIKNTVFPWLTITNPVSGTLSEAPFQLEGYASEPLDSLTFDLTNAAGVFTNQLVNLTGVVYDTNLLFGTTNYFQSDEIYPAGGLNIFTLHATDWAGNKTNVSVVINFVPSTNPPVLALVWPQAGANVIGSNFTLQAQVSDPTATVTATVNGAATPGLVQADGSVWVQNLALNPGINTVTLTASSALGGLMATNFTLTAVGTDLGLTIASGYLNSEWNQGSIFVAGTINDLSTNSVSVNGVPAAPSSYGEWTADYVLVNPYGMMSLNVQVSNALFVASKTFNYLQPTTVAMKSYSGHQVFADPNSLETSDNINWYDNAGGALNDSYFGPLPVSAANNGEAYVSAFGYLEWAVFNVPWEYADMPNELSVDNHIQTRVMLEPGGIAPAGTANAYLVFATAREFSDANINNDGAAWPYIALFPDWPANGINQYLPYGGDVGLPPEWLQINGQTLFNTGVSNVIAPPSGDPGPSITSLWGAAIVSAAGGETPDVTPVATRVYKNKDYTFDVQAYPLHMQILDANGNDLTLQTNTVIVGQQMNLTCQISFTNAFYTNTFVATNFQWTVPGIAITNFYVSGDAFQTNGYPVLLSNTNSQNANFWWADSASNRVVQCSATVNGAIVMGQAIFNVLRPTAKIEATTSSVRIGLDISGDVFRMYFGEYRGTNVDAIPGIQLSNNITMPTGINYNYGNTNYSVNWVQLVTAHSASLTLYGTNHTLQTSGVVLDTQYPASDVADSMDDSPGISLEEEGETAASYTSNFKTWVMFKPDGGGWVPLRTVNWSLDCAASLSGTNWVLSKANWSTNPPDADSGTTFPVWTDNGANTNSFSWHPPF